MSIDTSVKRKMVAGLMLPCLVVGVTAGYTSAAVNRRAAAWGYAIYTVQNDEVVYWTGSSRTAATMLGTSSAAQRFIGTVRSSALLDGRA